MITWRPEPLPIPRPMAYSRRPAASARGEPRGHAEHRRTRRSLVDLHRGSFPLIVPADGHDELSVALAVTRVNLRVSVTERIRRHAIVEPFTVENGLLTPTHKIRRMLVIRANKDMLTKLHA